ncbi:MAG: hypoxanthine phosphoribosyltransferase [Propionibacteriaceae bacterium]|nr:hypoxanthine phosphoribosyltransferase [Propionibacteriaceae bacterium]
MDAKHVAADLDHVIVTADEIAAKVTEMAEQIDADYAGRDVLLVGVLNGAVMVMSDLSRAMRIHLTMDWMAVSSYGAGTKSSGVVRILKDLTTDVLDKHVLIVEDIVDTGLTLSYLADNLRGRGAATVEIAAMFRKPAALTTDVDVKYIGFDIPNDFVVGYGLDFNGHYRNLRDVAVLGKHMYQ